MKTKKNFEDDFLEPVPIEKGDHRVLLGGNPPLKACRVIAEESYQFLYDCYLELKYRNQ